MKIIYRNKSSSGPQYQLLYGAAMLFDGMVRLLTTGMLCSDVSLWAAKVYLDAETKAKIKGAV